jgi:phosphoenolpyruvate-protein kinase (PTS system EI component)
MEELSMNPQTIPDIKRVIRSLSVADARSFLPDVLKQTTAKNTFELIKATYGSILAEQTYTEE